VLFRDGERFELTLWLKHLFREKEPTPNFTEAGFCFVIIMLAQFVAMGAFGQSIASVTKEELGVQMLKLMVIQQLAIVACPPLIMALILTTSFRSTLKLNWPHWKFLVVAVVLPLAMHPLCLELLASLQWFFPPLPEGATRMLKNMGDPSIPLWLILIAFAAAPAICEELAFRGFLLTGFSRGRRAWLAIVLSAVTFGLMHMIPQQVFNASLLGIVLGWLAIRGNSLLPGVVFHFLFNSISVLRERAGVKLLESGVVSLDPTAWRWFARLEASGLRYNWPTLIVCGTITGCCLWWMWQLGRVKPIPAGSPALLVTEDLQRVSSQHPTCV
jgi:sodium transport system permease protein